MRLCSGCQTKVPDTVRFCPECRAERCGKPAGDDITSHSYTDRERLAHLYNRAEWTKTARIQLKRFPICERCGERLAEIADHFVPAGIFIALCQEQRGFRSAERAFFWMGNLQSLCRPCHEKKTEDDKAHAGPWPDLFANPRREPKKWSF